MTALDTTCRARSPHLQRLVRIALLVLFHGQLLTLTGRVRGAEDTADPYDALYDVLMTRYGQDGKSYGDNESSPSISTQKRDDHTWKTLHGLWQDRRPAVTAVPE